MFKEKKEYWELLALHIAYHTDVKSSDYGRGESIDSSGKDSSLNPSSVPTSDVTLSHFLFFLDTCIFIHKKQNRK